MASLEAIRTAALALAERYARRPTFAGYARDLRHIAMDAQAAIDGCPASRESVAEFIEGNHELWMASEASDAGRGPILT